MRADTKHEVPERSRGATISERLDYVARRIKTLAAVTEDFEQYTILPIRRDRTTYAMHEAEHQLVLLQHLIRELAEIHQTNSGHAGEKESFTLCRKNDSTTASPKAPGKDSAPAS